MQIRIYQLTVKYFNLGLATFGAVCKAQGQSIVEENFDFKVLGVAAHELGHRYIYFL